jgi:hypothetical protein
MSAEFGCDRCGRVAGRVQLVCSDESPSDLSRPAMEAFAVVDRHAGTSATLVVESFCGTDILPVAQERLDAVARAVHELDASTLYELAYSYAPFHCPQCASCYCGEHWQWHEFEDERNDVSGIEGTCPQSHFHVLRY